MTTLLLIQSGEAAVELKVLRCLGKEEALFFKQKRKDSLYKLNQELINTLVNSPNLELNPRYAMTICQNNQSVSQQLLFYGLIKRHKLFITPNNIPHQVDYFIQELANIFFRYISLVQSEMPTANCLTNTIPELKTLLERYKYLQTDLPADKLLEDKNELKKIFQGLLHYQEIFKRCAKASKKSGQKRSSN